MADDKQPEQQGQTKEPEAITVPFEVLAGTPLRIQFTDTSGKRVELAVALAIFRVEDRGPLVPPGQRYNVRMQSSIYGSDR